MKRLIWSLITLILIIAMAIPIFSAVDSGPITMRTGANITMQSGYLTGLPNPSIGTDAAPWKSVQGANSTHLLLTGGTMAGNVAWGGYKLTGLGNGSSAQESATYSQAVRHSLATAANDFLVASASGQFVKKTLAETKTILGVTSGGSSTGWTASDDTWTYSSADDPTYVFTISGDKTLTYYKGMKINLTQTTVKYFVITKVAYSAPNTVVTIYGGTDYDLANAAITVPYYSTARAPAAFPMDLSKWSVVASDSADGTKTTPVAGTWYNIRTLSISVPIGNWILKYHVYISGAEDATDATLSTTNNGQTDSDFTAGSWYGSVGRWKEVSLTAKTTYYLNERNTDTTTIYIWGTIVPTKIEAICSLL